MNIVLEAIEIHRTQKTQKIAEHKELQEGPLRRVFLLEVI